MPNIGRYVSLAHVVCAPNGRLTGAGDSGQQHELLDWLEEVTFPMEARFADADFARRAYTSVVKRTLDYGVRPSRLRFVHSCPPFCVPSPFASLPFPRRMASAHACA